MTIRRKSKRRSCVRIRRHSQNPSATQTGIATSAAANEKPTDETAHFDSAESIERVKGEPRLVRMTPVESAISNAIDSQRGRDDSEVASRDGIASTQVKPDRSEANDQKENKATQSEQLPQHDAVEEHEAADGESFQDAVLRSAQAIEDKQNEGSVAEPLDTRGKSAEASSHDAVDFLMQDFMNSQPPPPTPEEVTWDIKIEPRPLPKDSRIARFATISTLLVSILGIGCFIAYNKLVVPTPVVLGMASGDVELPEPIHLSEGNSGQHAKKNSNNGVDTVASSEPSEAQARPPKQSTPSQIVPEIRASSTVASTVSPVVDQGPEVASSGESAPHVQGSTDIPPTSDQQTASERTSANERASNAEATSEGSTQTETVVTYRQTVENAFRLHKRSQRTKAKKEYQRALDINPNGAEALGKLAFYSLEESKYDDAIEFAERATRVDPNNSEGWIVLGAARQATADRKGAILAYRKCSESTGQYVNECRRLLR